VRQIAGDAPSAAETESVRRAVRLLVRDGRVEVKRGFPPHDVRVRYSRRFSHYVCRLPTDDERERRATVDAEARAWSAETRTVLTAFFDARPHRARRARRGGVTGGEP
jgi:hypothetical protein